MVAEIERDGVLYKVNYAWVNGEVVIDPDITEVEIDYVPVVVHGDDAPDDGVLTEIAEAEGEDKVPVWTGIMMRAGTAINRSHKNGKRKEYPAAVLKTAVAESVFNDVPALCRDDDEHVDLKKITTKIGMWGKAKWDEARQAIVNTFVWEKGLYPKHQHKGLKVAIAEGKTDNLPGCSVTGDAYTLHEQPNIIAKIQKIASCDWVSFPSAGGTLVSMAESQNRQENENMKKIAVVTALEARGLSVPDPLKQRWDKETIAEGDAADFMLAQLKAKRPNLLKRAGFEVDF